MKKAEMIERLLEVQNLHTKTQLEKMNATEVKKIAKEFGCDKPKENVPPTEEKPKEDNTPTEEQKEEFKSFCGFNFDPMPSGSCNTDCKSDNPDEWSKCVEHFKTSKTTPAKKPRNAAKSSVGVNKWGRRIGTQAELIERCLLENDPMTLDAIAEEAGCTKARVKRHFLRLIHKEKNVRTVDGVNQGDVKVTDNGLYFLPIRFPEMVGTSAYPKRGETAGKTSSEGTQKKTEPAADKN